MAPEVKKLYRSRKNKIIAGICGGLGEYFEIDPVIMRVIFVIIALAGAGFGLILYIILIFIIPSKPLTTAESK